MIHRLRCGEVWWGRAWMRGGGGAEVGWGGIKSAAQAGGM